MTYLANVTLKSLPSLSELDDFELSMADVYEAFIESFSLYGQIIVEDINGIECVCVGDLYMPVSWFDIYTL